MMGERGAIISGATAIISLLGEGATPGNSAGRLFRDRPVLAWTLERLSRARRVGGITVLCWEDQAEAVKGAVSESGATVLVKPRGMTASLERISAAQRWSDGWRGGLLGSCHFDRGFHAGLITEALANAETSLVLLVNACSALVDPELIDEMIDHAEKHPHREFFFTQAAPGLAGVALRPELLERLAKAGAHPGRLLAYSPDTPGLDPITNDMCVPVAPAIARTGHSFALDSDRQIGRVSEATASLNGELIGAGAERICALLDGRREVDAQPREVVLELTTRRASRPIFSPVTHLELSRGDMSIQTLTSVLEQLKGIDDLRLTLAGTGDPLLHPQFAEMLRLISQAGIGAVHIETDLLELSDEALAAMMDCRVDVMSIHLPAAKAETYRTIMGTDGLGRVLENLKRLLAARRALPLVAPIFTKCRENLQEMEPWYDHWLRVLGSAVIVGASDYAGQIPDHAVADMSPPRRRPCGRLQSRMTVHSDGTIPSCEQDVLAAQPMGDVAHEGVVKSWRGRLGQLRREHFLGELGGLRICGKCREWHRP
jgi:hypothetical protein